MNRPEDTLVKNVGSSLMEGLRNLGRAAVNVVTREATRQGLSPDDLPYVWWALATKTVATTRSADFDFLLDILTRTGTMPNYSAGFLVPDDLTVDEALGPIGQAIKKWAEKALRKGLLRAYQAALKSQVSLVPRATGGAVGADKAALFLHRAFSQILTTNSRWFEDGELLRRVVRSLPF